MVIQNKIPSKNILPSRETLAQYRFLVKPTVILAVIYLVAISALLRSNFYYIDDIARANAGYTEWEYYSRHLMVLSAFFLHADTYLTDVSPLPQLVAVIFMALAGSVSVHVITGKKNFSVWHLVAAIPMGLSPYFLECFSYKYDSAVMALSVLVSVLPLLAVSSEKKYAFVTFLCTLCMCMSYQASAGIFPVLVILICFRRWLDREPFGKTVRFALVSAGSYLAGLIVFRLFIMTQINTHASSGLATDNFLYNAVRSYYIYLSHYLADFKIGWHILIAVIALCFLYTSWRTAQRPKVLAVLLTIPVLLAVAALSLGVYPFLEGPIYSPRSMYGIGCTIAFLAICIFDRLPNLLPAKVACFLLSWAFFSFAFTYGNALYVQSQYTDYRIMTTIDDLVESGILQEPGQKTIRLTGSIGYAPSIRNMPQDFQMLNRLVPITFGDSSSYWCTYGFANYYGLADITVVPEGDYWDLDLPVIVKSVYHTIASDGEAIWINLYE